MEKTIERLVNGNIKVTIPIRLKHDGCKTVIRQPETEQTELDPETMSPLQKAVIQGFLENCLGLSESNESYGHTLSVRFLPSSVRKMFLLKI